MLYMSTQVRNHREYKRYQRATSGRTNYISYVPKFEVGEKSTFFTSWAERLKTDKVGRLGVFAVGATLALTGFLVNHDSKPNEAPYIVERGDTPGTIGQAIMRNTDADGDLRAFADPIAKQADGDKGELIPGQTVMVDAAADMDPDTSNVQFTVPKK